MAAIPDAKQLANLTAASFFVVDWNLYGKALGDESDIGVTTPAGLAKDRTSEMVGFLKDLKKVRFAPVFIFTNESVTGVESELREHPDLYDENNLSHTLIVSHT